MVSKNVTRLIEECTKAQRLFAGAEKNLEAAHRHRWYNDFNSFPAGDLAKCLQWICNGYHNLDSEEFTRVYEKYTKLMSEFEPSLQHHAGLMKAEAVAKEEYEVAVSQLKAAQDALNSALAKEA